MAAFKLLGDILNGTGWVTALSAADIASQETAESFLTVSNLAKIRQAHQITACSLYDMIKGRTNMQRTILILISKWMIYFPGVPNKKKRFLNLNFRSIF